MAAPISFGTSAGFILRCGLVSQGDKIEWMIVIALGLAGLALYLLD
jgi:hypothetical protein